MEMEYNMEQRQTPVSKSYTRRLSKAILCIFSLGVIILVIVWLTGSMNTYESGGSPLVINNNEKISIYVGNGCFWHTQYDTFMIEKNPPFSRSLEEITSLVGYAGSVRTSSDGYVCYHNFIGSSGSDYGHLGHAEVVQVELSNETTTTREQFTVLLQQYFEHGFQTTSGGRLRLDPQDYGAEYRNQIGIPGGVNGSLYDLIEQANTPNMQLKAGKGGPEYDTEGEYVVYIMDSLKYKFFQGEEYHQFHANTVLNRPVPDTYTKTLKTMQKEKGRLHVPGC